MKNNTRKWRVYNYIDITTNCFNMCTVSFLRNGQQKTSWMPMKTVL